MPTAAQSQYSATTRLDPVYRPDRALSESVNIVPSVTLARGTILGELTGTPGTFKAYATGNVDGSQVAKAILAYGCSTDASGNITIVGEFGQTHKSVPAYFTGAFRTAELTGLDAGALATLGKLANGSLAAGIIELS